MPSPLSRWLRGARPAPNPAPPTAPSEAAVSAALAEAERAFLRDGRHAPAALLIRAGAATPAPADAASPGALRAAARSLGADAAVTVSEARVDSPAGGAALDALRAVVERAGRGPETVYWLVVREPGRPARLGPRSTWPGAPADVPLALGTRRRGPAGAPARPPPFDFSGMSSEELRAAVGLAIGRLWALTQRPHRPGDERVYEECRHVILRASEALGRPAPVDVPPAIALARQRAILGESG